MSKGKEKRERQAEKQTLENTQRVTRGEVGEGDEESTCRDEKIKIK